MDMQVYTYSVCNVTGSTIVSPLIPSQIVYPEIEDAELPRHWTTGELSFEEPNPQ